MYRYIHVYMYTHIYIYHAYLKDLLLTCSEPVGKRLRGYENRELCQFGI